MSQSSTKGSAAQEQTPAAAAILNADFETGNLSGWKDWRARRAEISTTAQAGKCAVALGPESGQCAQEVKIRPNSRYRLSLWDKKALHAQLFTEQLKGGQFAFHTGEEANPHAIIDLGGKHSVRGVFIENREGYLTRRTGVVVSLSSDGQTWKSIWTASDGPDTWEIPVTSFVAGAHVPGKSARQVKIEWCLQNPDALHLQTVTIYGE